MRQGSAQPEISLNNQMRANAQSRFTVRSDIPRTDEISSNESASEEVQLDDAALPSVQLAQSFESLMKRENIDRVAGRRN